MGRTWLVLLGDKQPNSNGCDSHAGCDACHSIVDVRVLLVPSNKCLGLHSLLLVISIAKYKCPQICFRGRILCVLRYCDGVAAYKKAKLRGCIQQAANLGSIHVFLAGRVFSHVPLRVLPLQALPKHSRHVNSCGCCVVTGKAAYLGPYSDVATIQSALLTPPV